MQAFFESLSSRSNSELRVFFNIYFFIYKSV